jgi:hypothetical protein
MNDIYRSVDTNSETKTPDCAPNCFLCAHFKITWDAAFPRACTLFGVKGANLPSAAVFLSTGKHCFSFAPKNGGAK